jgi:hypothetical protein
LRQKNYHSRKQIFNKQNELINAKLEINRIGAEYAEKAQKPK